MKEERAMIEILAIDDDEGILRVMEKALSKEGYTVTKISDPLQVERLDLNRYRLILMDVMMPGMDGFALVQKIREQVDCPILFVTAKTEEEDVMRGLGLGGDDYITKPFGIGELRARVAAHLRREVRRKKNMVSVGKVQLYLQAKELWYQGEILNLTKSEYCICEYLALNHGQVFSKEQIYEHVFGFDGESDSSAITEHVKNIRAKCKKAGFEPIETVWGIGYKWKAD